MNDDFSYLYRPCSLCYEEEHEDKISTVESDKEDWKVRVCRDCEEKVRSLNKPKRYGTNLTRNWSKKLDSQREKIFNKLSE